MAAGVDACRGGWVAIVLDAGQFADASFVATFEQLLVMVQHAEAVGVDIPIGLPSQGVRAADAAARAFVGPRSSSVFPTPPRGALVASTYAEGRQLVPSLSAQSFALGKKMLEVEVCLEDRVFEVHPEVSFAALAGRHLDYSKRSWNGQMEDFPAGQAAPDDVLDAAIAAWSATRKAQGEAVPLPADPPLQDGRYVAIWY